MSHTPGTFTISLDFELLWGCRDKRSIDSYGRNILGARQAVTEMLALFKRYNINATWATVGLLFAQNKQQLLEQLPAILPSYHNSNFDPYPYLKTVVGRDEKNDPYHFAGSLIDVIAQQQGQEIATHTFSHFYCLEDGQSVEQFTADTQAAIAIASDHGHCINSIVFPRNQYDTPYLDVCQQLGIKAFRGNPASVMYHEPAQAKRSTLARAAKAFDALWPLDGHHGYQPVFEQHLLNIPASRFLRPLSQRMPHWLQQQLRNRIEQEMTHAAQQGLHYHLWWHPHNFGGAVSLNIHHLSLILQTYQRLHDQYGFCSRTMQQVTTLSSVAAHRPDGIDYENRVLQC